MQSLFDAMCVFSISALFFGVWEATQHTGYAFCDALACLQKTLRSLLFSRSAPFTTAVAQNIVASQLRVLRMSGQPHKEAQVEHLCLRLELMARIEDLSISFAGIESVRAFERYLARARPFCPLRKLRMSSLVGSVPTLFTALKEYTHLETLELIGMFDLKPFEESRLVDCGWLSNFRTSGGLDPPKSLVAAVARNKQRHVSCLKCCIAIIAIRNAKKALAWLPKELVTCVTRFLWETRNQTAWEGI
jgi:hypothetical protein